MSLSLHLIPKIEQIINHNVQAIDLLAEVADSLDDPTLRTIVGSIIGDENGHVKLFTLLLLLADENYSLRTPGTFQCSEVEETSHSEHSGIRPLPFADSPAADISDLKGNPRHNQPHDFKNKEKKINRFPLNQRSKVPIRAWLNSPKNKEIVWTFGCLK